MEKYRKIQKISNEFNGKVLLVQHISTKEMYALKKIPIYFCHEEVDNITSIYETFKTFTHPNIVQVYECFENTRNVNVIMEYAKGGNLAKMINYLHKEMPEAQVLHYFIQISSAIKYLHENKIIHCDLKPQNILLDESNNIKLADFDSIQILESIHQHCLTHVGTPLYMSPELIDFSSYDYKTDIWSLGCILYELCARTPPFKVNNSLASLRKDIKKGKYPPIPKHYNQNIEKLISRMLSINPKKRPTTNDILAVPFIRQMNSLFKKIKKCKSITNYDEILPIIYKKLKKHHFSEEEIKIQTITKKNVKILFLQNPKHHQFVMP